MRREFISYEKAIKMLPETEQIHTFRQNSIAIIGADWSREKLLEHMKESQDAIELTGTVATSMNHGIALKDDNGYLFIETKKEG